MEVAQLDSNNKVVNTFLVKKQKMIDINTGSVTQESCQAFCEGKFGAIGFSKEKSFIYCPINDISFFVIIYFT